jgi:hypothetical protein
MFEMYWNEALKKYWIKVMRRQEEKHKYGMQSSESQENSVED